MSQMNMIQAIRSAHDVMLEKDSSVIVFGQDIGYFGGVFRCTEGLQEKYGAGVQVLIVGDIYGEKQPYLDRITASGGAEVIRLVDGFVPDDTVEDYFLAADLAVLPYVSATQSGIIQIAYNYDLPVVTTNVGGLPEVVRDGETGFIVPPEDSAGLAAAIARFFDEDKADAFGTAVSGEKKKYSWDRMAEAIEELAGSGSKEDQA